MKISKLLHVSLALNFFLIVWFGLEWINPSINGIWFGLLITIISAFFKEINDKFGWFNFLLSDGKTKTGFNGRDFWLGVAIPFLITCIYYILYR